MNTEKWQTTAPTESVLWLHRCADVRRKQNAANVGYAVSVCYSANEAIKRIEDYYE